MKKFNKYGLFFTINTLAEVSHFNIFDIINEWTLGRRDEAFLGAVILILKVLIKIIIALVLFWLLYSMVETVVVASSKLTTSWNLQYSDENLITALFEAVI